jgi:hypothetical protein
MWMLTQIVLRLLNKIANNFSKQKKDIEERPKQIIKYIPVISRWKRTCKGRI